MRECLPRGGVGVGRVAALHWWRWRPEERRRLVRRRLWGPRIIIVIVIVVVIDDAIVVVIITTIVGRGVRSSRPVVWVWDPICGVS